MHSQEPRRTSVPVPGRTPVPTEQQTKPNESHDATGGTEQYKSPKALIIGLSTAAGVLATILILIVLFALVNTSPPSQPKEKAKPQPVDVWAKPKTTPLVKVLESFMTFLLIAVLVTVILVVWTIYSFLCNKTQVYIKGHWRNGKWIEGYWRRK